MNCVYWAFTIKGNAFAFVCCGAFSESPAVWQCEVLVPFVGKRFSPAANAGNVVHVSVCNAGSYQHSCGNSGAEAQSRLHWPDVVVSAAQSH